MESKVRSVIVETSVPAFVRSDGGPLKPTEQVAKPIAAEALFYALEYQIATRPPAMPRCWHARQ